MEEKVIKSTVGDLSKDENNISNMIWFDSRNEIFTYAIDAIKEKINRRTSQYKYLKETVEYEDYIKALEVLRNYPATIKAYEHEINELKLQLDKQPSDTKDMEMLKVDVEFLSEKIGLHDMLINRLERKNDIQIQRLERKIEELLSSSNDK